MVERTEPKNFDSFEGMVESAIKEENAKLSTEKAKRYQYKISIKTDVSSSGYMYTWVGIPVTATDTSVPRASVLDGYLKAIERLNPELKRAETVEDVLRWIVGKKFVFMSEQLGKAFDGHKAADYWVPTKLVEAGE